MVADSPKSSIPTRESDFSFHGKAIRQIPMLQDLPDYTFEGAEATNIARYGWKQPINEKAYRALLHQIRSTYPEQCDWNRDISSDQLLQYSTYYKGKTGYVVTINFYPTYFLLEYTEMDAPEDLAASMKTYIDGLQLSLPPGSIKGYKTSSKGFNCDELYQLNRALTPKELKKICRTVTNNGKWKYTEEKNRLKFVKTETYDNMTTRSMTSLTFIPGKDGKYRYVKISWRYS